MVFVGFFAGFCERASFVVNTLRRGHILSFKTSLTLLTLIILYKMGAADDVRSTYSALIKRWAKITELITRLDDEQRAAPPASAHRQDKQSAPSKINMPPWEAPVIWGFKGGDRR